MSLRYEPKNALTKQYQYLFELDDVILEFEEDALRAIAHKAMERETGARGLRAILEEFINPVMYEIPTETTVEKCIISRIREEWCRRRNRGSLRAKVPCQEDWKPVLGSLYYFLHGCVKLVVVCPGIGKFWKNGRSSRLFACPGRTGGLLCDAK